ncbi:chemotaxis protein CheB [Lysobacter tyrosinilyticus]
MSENGRRVALLARPGVARDRMREALQQAGANIVLEVDPTSSDEGVVLAAQPEVALIVLDSATDEALERFDGVLSNPKIEVLFEEAELAIGRVGWDAARWVRHLRAKLGHADSVLPPQNGAAASTQAASTQTTAVPAPVAVEIPARPEPEPIVTPAPASMPSTPVPAPVVAPKMELSLADMDEVAPVDVHSDMELVTIELGDEAAHYVHEHAAEPTPPLTAKLELELHDDTPTEIKFDGMGLEEDHPTDTSRFHSDMADLHARIAEMELVDHRTSAPTRGAVLIMAGIGGPDAVRQLLGALPAAFPRAVLVQQRLDGGHYDKLVAQMQRATTLPVKLAASGDTLETATVYILPPTVGLHENGQGLAFNDAPADLLTGLPASDSAVLMLSGADATQVDAVMKLAASGTLVAGQALDGCYDVAAPAALAARGGQSGKPQDLARRLAERWH